MQAPRERRDDGRAIRPRGERQERQERGGLTKALGVMLNRAPETTGTQKDGSLALKSDDEAPTRRSIFVIEETANGAEREEEEVAKKKKKEKRKSINNSTNTTNRGFLWRRPSLRTSLWERRKRGRDS